MAKPGYVLSTALPMSEADACITHLHLRIQLSRRLVPGRQD